MIPFWQKILLKSIKLCLYKFLFNSVSLSLNSEFLISNGKISLRALLLNNPLRSIEFLFLLLFFFVFDLPQLFPKAHMMQGSLPYNITT